jgi:hypothetical protein
LELLKAEMGQVADKGDVLALIVYESTRSPAPDLHSGSLLELMVH